jgi:two-component sensor histidine kinase/ligand-binding sensor domain-containing protein
MKIYKNIILLISFLFCFTILRGQNISYKLYTLHDGLPQSQIVCMFQDSRGYIWVGTHYGVSYFNGVKFQNITPKNGVPYQSVRQIQEDAKGNIWFYTGKWFCKYDGQKLHVDTANIRLSESWFFLDKSSVAWGVNVRDNLLYKSKDFKNWECVSRFDKTLENKKWKTLRYDRQRDRLILEDLSNQRFIYSTNKLIALPKGVGFQYYSVTNNDLRFGTSADSIFLLKDDGVQFYRKTNRIGMLDVIQRPNGKLYFIELFGNKLYALDNNNKLDTFPLNVAATNLLFEDRDKNVWIGTEEGLLRVYTEGFTNFDKKRLNYIWSMVEDTEGGMWFGEYFTHKLFRYHNNKFVEKKIDYAIHPQISKGDLADFYFGGSRDKLGNLYFPSGIGIKKYDGKTFSLFSTFKSDDHNLSMNFYLDNEKNIIVSGTIEGANVIDIKTATTKYYGAAKGLHRTAYVLGVGKDGEGNYWLGTNNGIAKLDLKKDSITQNYVHNQKGFPFYGFSAVCGDYKGNIWGGCLKGLVHYNTQKDSFTSVADTIIRTAVNAVTTYKDRYLVVSGIDGIYFLDLKAFYTEGCKKIVRCFNQHNGYLGIEPNQNGLYVDSKDDVWVSASDIVTKITPSELDMVQKPLIPYITTINNERITYESYQQIISLPRGVNSAKIFFEAVGFERPFNTEFQYKLDNGNWSNWRVEDFEVLDNLSSGVYKFSVRTRPAGTANESDIRETYIRFRINIPLYRESYFPFLAFFLLMVLGFGAWYYIQKQKRRSELTETLHEIDIEQRKNVELLNVEMSHRVRNNLNIMGNIMSMQATRVKQEEAKKVLHESVDRIHAMALLHDHLISKKGVETLKMSQYMADLCENVKKSYSDYSKNLAFSIEIDDVELAQKFGRDIGLIVSELLTNSIKHAFAEQEFPHVIIQLHEKANLFLLTYRDNGCGLPPDFDIHKTTSLGLKLIYGIADKFKGTVKIENKEGLYCQIGFEKKN